MQQVTVEELINYKILPFDIYSREEELLFSAGDVITPGKFLQLRHVEALYKKEEQAPLGSRFSTDDIKGGFDEKTVETVSTKSFLTIDQIDISKVKTAINKNAKIPATDQIRIKTYYDKLLENSYTSKPSNVVNMYHNIRDKISQDFSNIFSNTVYPSQLKLLGEYEKCHALNVAILAACLAQRLEKSENFTADLILAALLHDIGKNHLPPNILIKHNLTVQEQKLFIQHPQIGYDIILNELGLRENIAKIVLEHHEMNDGTGYPQGYSGNKISVGAQIIAVCNYFDNLTFNRTNHKIRNGRDALKAMLELGSRIFATDILYTFVYMFNYNDTSAFEEMVL